MKAINYAIKAFKYKGNSWGASIVGTLIEFGLLFIIAFILFSGK